MMASANSGRQKEDGAQQNRISTGVHPETMRSSGSKRNVANREICGVGHLRISGSGKLFLPDGASLGL